MFYFLFFFSFLLKDVIYCKNTNKQTNNDIWLKLKKSLSDRQESDKYTTSIEESFSLRTTDWVEIISMTLTWKITNVYESYCL